MVYRRLAESGLVNHPESYCLWLTESGQRSMQNPGRFKVARMKAMHALLGLDAVADRTAGVLDPS